MTDGERPVVRRRRGADQEPKTGKVVEHNTPEEWADKVRAGLAQSVGGTIQAGRALIDAREDIGKNEFDEFLRTRVRISQPQASKLMKIAGHPVLADHSTWNILPSGRHAL